MPCSSRDSSIMISRWRCASSAKSNGFDDARLSIGAKAFCKASISAWMRSRSSALRRARGSAWWSAETSLRHSFASSSRKRLNSRNRPPVPAGGRVPRNTASSRPSIAVFHAPGARPSRHSGCFSIASSVGGSNPLVAASAARRAKTPAEVSISTSPPESSKARSHRVSAAITRRASARSGVTSAADLSRCRASRIAMAIASASISGLGASTTARFVMPPAIFAATSGCFSRSCQTSVLAEGRIDSDASRSRPPSAGGWRISTSLRLMPKRSSSACMAYCGWFDAGCSANLPSESRTPPMLRQASSSRSVSRPGSTTAPCGSEATACRNFAVAGIEPVEPAAITGPWGCAVSRLASAAIRRSRRAAGSIRLISARWLGQAMRAMRKNSSECCQ